MTKKIRQSILLVITFFGLVQCSPSEKSHSIQSGEIWYDSEGQVINAHGGGLLYHDGKYYWYGEFNLNYS